MKIFGQPANHPILVNWVKTKPRLTGYKIPFRGTYLVFYCVGDIRDTYTQYKSKLVPPEGIRFPANLGLVLT